MHFIAGKISNSYLVLLILQTKTHYFTCIENLILDWSTYKLHFESTLYLYKNNHFQIPIHMSFVTRKPVFGISDQVRLKPACSVTEVSQRLEISYTETRGIILSRQRITKALIRLRGCAGWSASLLFAYAKSRFSLYEAQLYISWLYEPVSSFLFIINSLQEPSQFLWTITDFIPAGWEPCSLQMLLRVFPEWKMCQYQTWQFELPCSMKYSLSLAWPWLHICKYFLELKLSLTYNKEPETRGRQGYSREIAKGVAKIQWLIWNQYSFVFETLNEEER